MVLAEKNPVSRNPQIGRDLRSYPKLVDHPGDHRFAKYLVRLRVGLQNGHQDAVEFSKGLLEKCDVVHVAALYSTTLQAEPDGLLGIIEIVLDAGETFLFRSRNQLTVVQQHGGSVVVIEIGRAS